MSGAAWTISTWPWLPVAPVAPRLRVIIDNDFAGDPDDLFQTAHHLLSPSVDVRGIVCSHLRPEDPFYPAPDSADQARRVMQNLADVMRLDVDGRLFTGSNAGLVDASTPQESGAARFIVAEAMRDEPGLAPLVVACGGGLTDIASAYLMEPRIADRLSVIWIGGPEHEGLAEPPPGVEDAPEYNLRIDVTAGQVVFNASTLPLWIVPRDVYRQCLASDVELRRRVGRAGALGALLYGEYQRIQGLMEQFGAGYGETYALGDSPLVLLTALRSFFEPDSSSSVHVVRPCPTLEPDGSYTANPDGRAVRVYTQVDVRLMFEDFFGKLNEFADWLESVDGPVS